MLAGRDFYYVGMTVVATDGGGDVQIYGEDGGDGKVFLLTGFRRGMPPWSAMVPIGRMDVD